jgi:hypothetical protein
VEPFRRHDPPKCTQAEFDPPKCTEAEIDPPKGRFSQLLSISSERNHSLGKLCVLPKAHPNSGTEPDV